MMTSKYPKSSFFFFFVFLLFRWVGVSLAKLLYVAHFSFLFCLSSSAYLKCAITIDTKIVSPDRVCVLHLQSFDDGFSLHITLLGDR